MGKRFRLEKIYTRQGAPDFLDLPWEYHLDLWSEQTDRIVEVERGRSRHTVVFVHYEKIYAVKELPGELAKHEYRILKQMEEMDLPSVKPVGYANLIETDSQEKRSIIITEYLKTSLPYRSIFMRSDLQKYQDQLLDALAVLLVTIHLKNIYWGDCSLSNILFRKDAGQLQAYLVDAETSEINSTLSDSKRNYELTIMNENVAGELMDLSQVITLPESLDIFEIGQRVENRYRDLWRVLNSDEIIKKSENYKINHKIKEINDLGFSVDEIEISSRGEGDLVQVKPRVTDRNYHKDKFQSLTGFSTQENIARKLLNEIYEVKTKLTEEKKREIPLSNAAFYWSNKVYFPVVEDLDLIDNTENALHTYMEIFDIKQEVGQREHRDITSLEALRIYKNRMDNLGQLHLFKRGFRRSRTFQGNSEIHSRKLPQDWKSRVIYQIYPSSFYDTDANGVGDIRGITEKLDYLAWLGVSAIRLNPIYPSAMSDRGYDVTHFKGIDPLFGNLEEFDTMVEEAHRRDIKVILDIIPSHSSIKHPWFEESKQSVDNPKRDWYIWKQPGTDGGPPNNWLSITGESAWTFDEGTNQYYLHSFLESEADLNWRNPGLRQKMLDVIRFWLNHNIDGIFLVMLSWLAKDPQFRNDPENPSYDPSSDFSYNANIPIYSYDRPELVDYVKDIVSVTEEYDSIITISGLDQFSPLQSYLEGYDVAKLITVPLNNRLLDLDWTASATKDFVDQYEEALGMDNWPNYMLNSHDYPRIVNRIGRARSRIAGMLLLTLRGIPILYYGEEIGMANVNLSKEQIKDPWEKIIHGMGRDRQRTPMQWDNKRYAGFSGGEPWLPTAQDLDEVNVNKQTYVFDSMLNLYRELLQIRKEFECLRVGDYHPLDLVENAFLFIRETKHQRILIALNFSDRASFIDLEPYSPDILLLTSYLDQRNVYLEKSYNLRPNEGIIVLLNC